MSHLLDRLNFLKPTRKDVFSEGHGQTTTENRDWEDTYRSRWRHDKIVRSTHGVNCTAHARGRSMSSPASSPGKRSRPTIPAQGRTCPTTSRAAARAAPHTAGIFTPRTG